MSSGETALDSPWTTISGFRPLLEIGKGGMGSVWLARHDSGTDVAIKILLQQHGQSHGVDPLLHEVEAIASLNHPGVVDVYDFGRLEHEFSMGNKLQLAAKTAWFAMEYVPGGALQPGDIRDFDALRELLLQVLDALAHAHARGVIHRDIKPGNVLCDRAAGRYLLTDFGIAHATRLAEPATSGAVASASAGTPLYMAPEQFLGRWRSYGPWTDLYALGCLAWDLSTGNVPFVASNVYALADKHLGEQLGAYRPRFDVPRGFHAWLRRMLAKRPLDRFFRAADACYALTDRLDELALVDWVDLDGVRTDAYDPWRFQPVARDEGGPTQFWTPDNPTIDPLAATMSSGYATMNRESSRTGRHTASVRRRRHLERDSPPLPRSWRGPTRPRRPELTNVGLGLVGLREVSFVDRDPERERLWGAVEQLVTKKRALAVVVEGDPGVGKSRLVEWFGRRCDETGIAQLMLAEHSPNRPSAQGLARMLAAYLRCGGLSHADATARMRWLLDVVAGPDAAESDAASIAASMAVGEVHVGETVPTQLHRGHDLPTILRTLSAIATIRPIVIWVDDAHWGAETLRFVQYTLAQSASPPILFVLTLRTDLLEGRGEAELLEGIEPYARILVSPLADQHELDLIQSLVPLSRRTAQAVADRAKGHPLFAVQLVADWARRGLLHAATDGFALVDDAPAVPDDVDRVWLDRIAALAETSGHGEGLQRILEVAALLGDPFQLDLLASVVDHMSLPPIAGVDELLVRQNLATRPGPESLRLSHGLLRDTLERQARQAGRDREIHDACFTVMRPLVGEHDPAALERLAIHAEGAGRYVESIETLGWAAWSAAVLGDRPLMERLVGRFRQLASEHLVEDDALWALVHVALATAGQAAPDMSAPVQHAKTALERTNAPRVQAIALRALSHYAQIEGDLEAARQYAERARTIARDAGDERGYLRGLLQQMRLLAAAGDITGARRVEAEARNLAPNLVGHRYEEALVDMEAGDLGKLDEQLELAIEQLESARECFNQAGDTFREAICNNRLGDVARLLGRVELAREAFARAARLFGARWSVGQLMARCNVGLLDLHRGDARAVATLEETLADATGQPMLSAILHMALAAGRANLHELDRVEEHIAAVEELLRGRGLAILDVAEAAVLAAEWLPPGSQLTRRCWAIAADQWRRLGRDTEAADAELELV